jgi:hypothetical protein
VLLHRSNIGKNIQLRSPPAVEFRDIALEITYYSRIMPALIRSRLEQEIANLWRTQWTTFITSTGLYTLWMDFKPDSRAVSRRRTEKARWMKDSARTKKLRQLKEKHDRQMEKLLEMQKRSFKEDGRSMESKIV